MTSSFDAEVARVRASGTLGEGGRLLELFDFLSARGADTAVASQAEIAETVFGHTETSVDDATVRVYIHRLRKRLDAFYAEAGEDPYGARLTLPPGTYALRLARDGADAASNSAPAQRPVGTLTLALLALAVLAGVFLLGRELPRQGSAPPSNALWQPFLDSKRPKLVVVGDYYMFGEIDQVSPERGRLIRDFRVNSPSDLIQMQDLEPGRYGAAEDVGLNYLPFSVAYGLTAIVPILARDGRQVTVIAASQLRPEMLNHFDVVYVGLFSGMALLEDVNFMNSGFAMGESYDEIYDNASGKTYTSEEARNLPSQLYYDDYGYIARFHSPSGALVAVIAGARDTGLRGVSPIAVKSDLPSGIERVARGGDFEALYQITGQQGADLSEHLLTARRRH
ncbi:MAG: hypothetical protein ABIT16_12410 [Croceibacterium sp.]